MLYIKYNIIYLSSIIEKSFSGANGWRSFSILIFNQMQKYINILPNLREKLESFTNKQNSNMHMSVLF